MTKGLSERSNVPEPPAASVALPMVTPAVPSPFTTTLELVVPTATLKVPDTGAVMVVGVVAPVLGSVTTNVWPLVAVALAPAVGCTASAIETGVTA